jgi:hypothetical protein
MHKIINKFVEAKVPLKIGVVGYSDKKFDKKEALELLRKGLDELVGRRKDIVIVSGLTNLGIPAIAYKEAVLRGYRTVGIACKKASEYELFEVDESIILGDEWGEESDRFLEYIDVLLRVGGGKQSLAEAKKAKEMGKRVIEYELELLNN